jgi:hypothetical protein
MAKQNNQYRNNNKNQNNGHTHSKKQKFNGDKGKGFKKPKKSIIFNEEDRK